MPELERPHLKLPGGALGWAGSTRLWLGEDHLLAVISSLGVERYRRYYFRDIEALVLRRTARRLVWNSVHGGIAGVCGALAAVFFTLGAQRQGTGYFVAGGIFSAPTVIAFICLAINTLAGQTCALFVQTAAGLDRLGAPVRMRAARRAVERMTPLIEEAQRSAESSR